MSLSDTTFQIEADKLMIGARFFRDVELDAIINTVSRAHSIAPLLDPTAYQRQLSTGHMDDAARLASAARKVVDVYDEIEAKMATP